MSAKDLTQMLGRVRRQGFSVRRSGGGHWTVTAPCGAAITVPATPCRGHRTMANIRADLRRIGADL